MRNWTSVGRLAGALVLAFIVACGPIGDCGQAASPSAVVGRAASPRADATQAGSPRPSASQAPPGTSARSTGVPGGAPTSRVSSAPTGAPPTTAVVSGHLSWPDCQSGCPPLGGTPVHFNDAAANQTLTATSDGSGAYSISLPSGTYTAIAGNADRSPYQKQLTVRAGDRVTLDLSIALPTG